MTTPKAFSDAAERACDVPLNQVAKVFADLAEGGAPYLCLDLAFQHTLLTKGMKLDDAASVTVAKKVRYKGEEFEAAWPLGAAINTLSS